MRHAGDFDLSDKPRSGRPSFIDDDIVEGISGTRSFSDDIGDCRKAQFSSTNHFGSYSENKIDVEVNLYFVLFPKQRELSGGPTIHRYTVELKRLPLPFIIFAFILSLLFLLLLPLLFSIAATDFDDDIINFCRQQ